MATNIYGVKVSRKGLDIEKLYQMKSQKIH